MDASTAATAISEPAARRPRIYVYDLPAMYNTRMVQYRVVKVSPCLAWPTQLQPVCWWCAAASLWTRL